MRSRKPSGTRPSTCAMRQGCRGRSRRGDRIRVRPCLPALEQQERARVVRVDAVFDQQRTPGRRLHGEAMALAAIVAQQEAHPAAAQRQLPSNTMIEARASVDIEPAPVVHQQPRQRGSAAHAEGVAQCIRLAGGDAIEPARRQRQAERAHTRSRPVDRTFMPAGGRTSPGRAAHAGIRRARAGTSA